MASVQVILKEKIANLGSEADIVSVKAGYARNYLVPQGKAYEASPGNLRHIKQLQSRRAEREGAELAEAQAVAGRIKKVTLQLELSTGIGGKAFGSITNIDIATALQEQASITVDRHHIHLEKPIKTTGKHEVTVRVHPEVTTEIRLNVFTPVAEQPAEGASTDKA